MRSVLVIATFVALASATTVTQKPMKFKSVDPTVIAQQYKVLELLENINQINFNAEYYKVGKAYDLKTHVGDFTNKEAFDKFWKYYEHGDYFKETLDAFTVFEEKWRTEAKILFDLFYYAKDFETFYKTAAWARVHLDDGLFAYTFYIAVLQRIDTTDLILPAFYEIWPEFFINNNVIYKMYYAKMRGLPFEQFPEFGIVEEGDFFLYYANYSNYYTYGKNEHKISYLTEDIGWNAFYTYFHGLMPFWEKGDQIAHGLVKERRGEIYYFFYQQLLARYYMERLSNGLGSIPTFSWLQPFQYKYRPFLSTYTHPFVQRCDNYVMQNEKNLEDLRFVRNYESTFLTLLEKGQTHAYQQSVDFHNSKSVNFVGNFWQTNPDLYEKLGKNYYYRSYEMAARRILGGAWYYNDDDYMPSALDFYQTSLRDPAFYQIYNKIVSFMLEYKTYLQPYTQDNLHYIGVSVKDVELSPLYTYFDFYRFNASNAMIYSNEELKTSYKKSFMVVQPRLNHEEFEVTITVKSDVEEEASVKVFLGPKYDEMGNPIKLEDNWMNFVELDWFNYKLTKGDNVIKRSSDDFYNFKDDSASVGEIYKYLSEGKLPVDMMDKFDNLPKRLMLPRGKKGGFPLQMFVVVYPSQPLTKEKEILKNFFLDEKPFGYPFDRPVSFNFWQPNMYMKDVLVYHKHEEYPWFYQGVEYKH